MKNLLKYDEIIQQVLIILFFLLIVCSVTIDLEFILLFYIIFITIAVYQYSVNIFKFIRKEFVNTIARKVYIWLSTYIVVTFLLAITSIRVDVGIFNFLMEGALVTWIVLTPILIILSLFISFGDSKVFEIKKLN